MDKSLFNDFVSFLRDAHSGVGGLSGLGLVVREDLSETSAEEVFCAMGDKVPVEKLVYDADTDDQAVIARINAVVKQGKWLFLIMKRDLSKEMIGFLDELMRNRVAKFIDLNTPLDQAVEKSRIVAFADRSLVEHGISYRYFYRLFGPVMAV